MCQPRPDYGIGTIGTVSRAYEGKGAYEENGKWELAMAFTRQAFGNMMLYSCLKKPDLIFTAILIILNPTLILI